MGETVTGGTVVTSGEIIITAERVGRDTLLSQIIDFVEKAQASKPKIQKLADRAVVAFIPSVLCIAVLAFSGWYFVVGESLVTSLTVLISILVIACPCALGLATPTAVAVGMGRGAELGILIKSSEIFEVAPKITVLILDKTGTLTVGKPVVTSIITGESESELLMLAAGLEVHSIHPLAKAVVKKAHAEGLNIPQADDIQGWQGKGMTGRVSGKRILLGSETFLKESNVLWDDNILNEIKKSKDKSLIFVAVNGKLAGLFTVSDALRPEATRFIKEARALGLKTVMLTGDAKETALAVGKTLGIDVIEFEMLPKQKADYVKSFQEKGEVVAFVGDGSNDAPALTQANLGIALGSGTDVAGEAGDVVMTGSNLLKIVDGLNLANKVMGQIKQNLFWAFGYNIFLIPAAAGLWYLLWGIPFQPEWGGIAMALSSVSVMGLSLRLKNFNPR